jgi:hypothetical protein
MHSDFIVFADESGDQHELATPFLFERRGKKEDVELELVFRRLCDGASSWGKMPGFLVEFFDKKANLPGLQIADLVSMPIGQHVIRPEKRSGGAHTATQIANRKTQARLQSALSRRSACSSRRS